MAVRILTIWLFIVFAIIVVVSPLPVSSRKLLEMKKQENLTVREEEKNHMPHVTKTTTLTALPKGKIQNSTPSKKGYAVISNVKHRSRHLSTVYRLLQSVPSPGVGHWESPLDSYFIFALIFFLVKLVHSLIYHGSITTRVLYPLVV